MAEDVSKLFLSKGLIRCATWSERKNTSCLHVSGVKPCDRTWQSNYYTMTPAFWLTLALLKTSCRTGYGDTHLLMFGTCSFKWCDGIKSLKIHFFYHTACKRSTSMTKSLWKHGAARLKLSLCHMSQPCHGFTRGDRPEVSPCHGQVWPGLSSLCCSAGFSAVWALVPNRQSCRSGSKSIETEYSKAAPRICNIFFKKKEKKGIVSLDHNVSTLLVLVKYQSTFIEFMMLVCILENDP